MYTANTMSTAIEAMGMALPFDASYPAVSAAKERESYLAGQALLHLVEEGIKPRDIITRKSLENAYTAVLALGGSTNALLHLMAIAREAEVDWSLADFDRLGPKVPHLGDLKPSGRFVMYDLHRVGGTAAVFKALLEAGLLHGDCLTCTGATLAENLKAVPSIYARPQDVVKPINRPLYSSGHLVILKGNLAPDGAVAKVAGLKTRRITGPARVFDQEEACFAAIQERKIRAGDVVVIRNEGPCRRAGDARDACRHRRTRRSGARREGWSGDRRAFLGRNSWPGRGSRFSGSVGGRPAGPRPRRRPHYDRRRFQATYAGSGGRGNQSPPPGVDTSSSPSVPRSLGEVRPDGALRVGGSRDHVSGSGNAVLINAIPIEDTFAEAFPMTAARVLVTAETPAWALTAGQVATGYASSVIGCDAEAGIERQLTPQDTPDGRPGVSLLIFAFNRDALQKAVINRVGQCVLTCPTTACYNGLPLVKDKNIRVGGNLRFFGDTFQISKKLDGRRLWRLPVMDGEFACEDYFGTIKGVAGGNFLILGTTQAAALRAAEASSDCDANSCRRYLAVSGRNRAQWK